MIGIGHIITHLIKALGVRLRTVHHALEHTRLTEEGAGITQQRELAQPHELELSTRLLVLE